MADWTTIPDASLEPGKPIRSVDGLALRDNPVAIAEGAAGAPRIQTQALAPPTAGTAHIIRRVQEAGFLAGSDSDYPATGNHDKFSERQHLGVTVLVPGVITAYAQHRRVTGDQTPAMRVLKNGALVQEWGITSSSFVARQVNISVDVGDVIIFQQRGDGGFNPSAPEWRYLRIYSDNPNMAVA